MDRKPESRHWKQCAVCGAEIPEDRRAVMPGASTCVKCQAERELANGTDDVREGTSCASASAEPGSVEVKGNLVLSGNWSGNLMDLIGREREFRQLMASGDVERVRTLMQALPVEEQAALVAMSDAPEEMLSMTGADRSGLPGYSRGVVELLPAETLGNLVSVNPDEWKFNTELIRAMSPGVLQRTMAETLDSVDNPVLRTRVSWEWLKALATLKDFDRRAALLRAVDPSLLEDALLDRMDDLNLNEIVSFGGVQVFRFRLFSAEGLGGTRPSAFIDDPEIGIVLDALYEAEPTLFSRVVRGAWERAADGNDEDAEPARQPNRNQAESGGADQ